MNLNTLAVVPSRFHFLTKYILFFSFFYSINPVYAVYENNFVDDSSLTGNVFFWNRDRERKNIEEHKYEKNLRHSSFNTNLDFKSGYMADRVAIELGGYGAWEVSNGGNGHPNEIGFSGANTRWDEDWKKDVSGLSFYKALVNFKLDDKFWLRAGYIQPSGQTLLAPHLSLLPGTYRGVEFGSLLDFDDAGALSMSYMWTDKYKAPWYKRLYEFKQWGKGKKIDYLHSAGLKYDFKNDLVLETAFGQAQNYMNQFFGKASYKTDIFNNPLTMSYQFYGAKDQSHKGKNVYDGLAWLQAATLGYQMGPVGLRLEGVVVKAEGEQGYFLQRMTPDYASSNGRLDVWWNSRSDFNANGEKAIFTEVTYDLGDLSNYLNGWKAGMSYAYGWDAKPSTNKQFNQKKRLIESAYNFDLGYTVQNGWIKDTSLQLHYTKYNNHTNIPSWEGGYGNIFQDEHDIKFIVTVPFTIFNAKQK
ncbi:MULTISPECIES: OprD family outer membrane porin [unclassified Gilliamella]|uniref:OprD family outer membrane porin n=1 Tax=unclassified Gilliamella TaxID=2685620 RepID=UPI00226A38E4|nr:MULTISPECIES: OprD family outer membrane porin [unclassified Gilliamella]MCX8641865.1 OprD family outer membrane porin [Gilliamella sp. B3835]MCX8706665.1 OprD family outer membrane porin [Gilliamella sp. B3783]MCX8708866.1 OprD family outer membrane porin [Gilliamella sp. B3780]MCX8713650.1 OprD family outer membrane porin [Gilliamella sp. B3781]MCX8715731.1 OprD family outer membrane porin [Gilliamella sp. B3784]